MTIEKEGPFDPYRKWLGIPKAQRPPTFYQLLGLVHGEADADVIEEAAIRQTTHLRAYQVGPHADECTRILNEVSTARQMLRNPQKRQEYDAKLAQIAAKRAAAAGNDVIPAAPAPVAESAFADLDAGVATPARLRPVAAKPSRPASGAGKRSVSPRKFSNAVLLAAAAGAGLLLVALSALVALLMFPAPQPIAPRPAPVAAAAVDSKPAAIDPRPSVDPKPTPDPKPMPDPKGAVEPRPPVPDPAPDQEWNGLRLLKTFALKTHPKILVATDDGRLLYGGDAIQQLDPAANRHLTPLDLPDPGPNGIRVAVSPDGKTTYVALPEVGSLDAYENAQAGDKKRLIGSFADPGQIIGMEMSRDGTTLLTATPGGDVSIWNTATRKRELQFAKHAGFIRSVSISADGALAGSICGKTIQIWNVREKRLVSSKDNSIGARSFDFSPDGQSLLVTAPKGILAASIRDFEWKTLVPDGDVHSIAFANEKSFVAMSNGGLGIYQWPSGKAIRTAKIAGDMLRSMCLSPDGRLMFVGRADDRLQVFATDRWATLAPYVRSVDIPGGGAAYLGRWHLAKLPAESEFDLEIRKDRGVLSAQIKIEDPTRTGTARINFLRMTSKLRGCVVREGELPAPWTNLFEIEFDPPGADGEMKATLHAEGEKKSLALVRVAPVPKESSPAAFARVDVPEEARIKDLAQTIHATYKADYAKKSAADRTDLAEKLLKLAAESKDDPAGRYVLYREARDLAVAAGNWPLAEDALEGIEAGYKVDVLPQKEAALALVSKAVLGKEAAAEVAEAALEGVGEAVAADQLPLAGKFSGIAAYAASKSANVPLTGLCRKADAELKRIVQEAEGVKKARETLKTMPDDPAANLAVGRYEALRRGDWEAALPLLAKGSDADLAGLARKELDSPRDGAAEKNLGDAWWDAAEKEKASTWIRSAIQGRAAYWYRQARAQVTGLSLKFVNERLKAIDDAPSPFRLASGFAPIKTMTGHAAAVSSLHMTADGKRLISSGLDGAFKSWDLKLGKNLTSFAVGQPLYGFAISPSGQFVVFEFKSGVKTVSTDKLTAERWPSHPIGLPGAFWVDDGRIAWLGPKEQLARAVNDNLYAGHSMHISATQVSPSHQELVTIGEETWLCSVAANGGLGPQPFKTLLRDSTAAQFAPNRPIVAIATSDGKIGILDTQSHDVLATLEGAPSAARCLAFSTSGDRLFSGGADGNVLVWNVGSGKEVHRFANGSRGVAALAVTIDGKQLVTGGNDGVLRIWAMPRERRATKTALSP